ncbi:MAG: HlyD family type I secretion periplasmic adaptor subunit [Pseudomonadota bacterium]
MTKTSPPAPEDVLDEAPIASDAKRLIWVIVAAVCAAVAWAAITPVYEVVSGTGQIRPDGFVQPIEHLEGGIVAEVFVEEGARVEKGARLMRLRSNDVEAELNKVRSEMSLSERQIARVETLISEFRDSTGTTSDTIKAEWDYRYAQIAVFRSDREILSSEISALAAQRRGIERELDLLSVRRTRLDQLAQNELVTADEMHAIALDQVRLERDLERVESERLVREASLARSRAKEAEVLAGLRRDAALELEALREQHAVLEQTATQLSDRLSRTLLVAPAAGIVHNLTVRHPGEVVGRGDRIAEIVPVDARLFADIEVSADRINGVSEGRDARLKILAHDFTRFGALDATVDRVSPTSIARQDGAQVFLVSLSFDEKDLERATGGERQVSVGMTVSADIRTDDRTVLGYLMKPVRVIADRAMTEL